MKRKLGNATKTTLAFGSVRASVALYKTTGKPRGGSEDWETAGPTGGVLRAQATVVAAPEKAKEEPLDVLGELTVDEGVAPSDFKALQGSADVLGPDLTDDPPAGPEDGGEFKREESPAESPVVGPVGERQEFGTDAEPVRGPGELKDGTLLPVARELKSPDGSSATPPTETAAPAGAFSSVLVEEGSGAIVPREEVRRGLRLDDGTFVDLTEHLARIEADTKLEVMRIISFVPANKIPHARITGSYYLATGDKTAARPLRLLYDAMKERGRFAVVKWTKRTRQSVGVIRILNGEVLVLEELAWEETWIDPTPRVKEHLKAEVTETELQSGLRLVDALSDSVKSIEELEDDAVARRRDLRGYVMEYGTAPLPPEDKETDDGADLAQEFAALLRRSAETEKSGG